MKHLLVLPFFTIVCGLSAAEAAADLVYTVGTSTINASASVVRGGSGAFDSFSNSDSPLTGSGGLLSIDYFADVGPVAPGGNTALFPGTTARAQSFAESIVDFTLLSGGVGLEARTTGEILSTDGPGINAGYGANNGAISRLDFQVNQTTTVRLLATATQTGGAFWQIQLGGGAVASNYFSSSTPGTESIDDIYTFEPGYDYFIRAISDSDLALVDGDSPFARSSSVSLTFTAVPEPGSFMMSLLGFGALAVRRRRV